MNMEAAIKHHFNKDIKEKIKMNNGWKETWRLTLSDGQKVIFRACSDYTDYFEREKFFYDNINQKLGKICPEVYLIDGTREYYGKPFQISEYITGKSLRQCLETEFNEREKREIYYRIGETAAMINQVEINPDHPYVSGRVSWETWFADELLSSQLKEIVKNNLITAEEVRAVCDKMKSKTANKSLSFLHRDIRPDNMIYHDGKLFVIDAETCEFGDPLDELARIELEWHYWEMFDCLLSGYKSIADIDTDSELIGLYQLETLGELLDMHYNHGCMNSTTPYFLNKFNEITKQLKNY